MNLESFGKTGQQFILVFNVEGKEIISTSVLPTIF